MTERDFVEMVAGLKDEDEQESCRADDITSDSLETLNSLIQTARRIVIEDLPKL